MTIRGGGNRQLTWHTMPTKRMGPAARSFAADAHDCIMVRIQTDLPNTSVRREEMRPMASSPRIEHADINRRHQTLKLRKRPISRFIVPPRARASRRCETQVTLGGKPPSYAKRFGPLTPSARSANLIARRRDEEPPSCSEQRTEQQTKNNRLTEKAPYKSAANPESLD